MPWLHAIFPHLSRAAAAVYYRVTYAGEAIPPTGPVLLVANHPNSLLDPVLVAAVARRPVRFLAKAPLFDDPKIAFLVKASGAIPVYRRVDGPSQVEKNFDAFRAVHSALALNAAVGIFPEGLSHSEPALATLKTGAARIGLGAFTYVGEAFPIVPVGLMFRHKDVFRTEALVLVGRAIPWDDLAPRGMDDTEAVRLLTERIERGLRHVTVNLERWQDRPLVECAVRVWEAERQAPVVPDDRVARLKEVTRILAEVRRRADPEAAEVAADLEAHRRRLRRLRLRPADLTADVGLRRALAWTGRRAHLLLPLGAVIAAVSAVLFYVPYRATGALVNRVTLKVDERSTWKLLVGLGVYATWVVVVAALAAITWGPRAGLLALVGGPCVGMVGLVLRDRWRGAWSDARRFFLLRSRRDLVTVLQAEQRDLAERLQALYEAFPPPAA